jgi:argininosuccinate lyase
MLVQLKGLPLTYNRDLSYDKHEVFDTIDMMMLHLPAVTGMIATMRVHREVLAKGATEGFTLATDVADWLARQGIPFREAHEIVGSLVQRCEKAGIDLNDLTDAELAEVDPHLTPKVRSVLDVREALKARCGFGATAPERVLEQLANLDSRMNGFSSWAQSRVNGIAGK